MVEASEIPDPRPYPWDSFSEEAAEWDAARAQGSAQQPQGGTAPAPLAECQAPTTRWIPDEQGGFSDPSFISA